MNVIKKVLLALFVVFALVGCGDTMSSKEAVENINNGQVEGVENSKRFSIYADMDNDIAVRYIIGSIIDLRELPLMELVFNISSSSYSGPIIHSNEFQTGFLYFFSVVYVLCLIYALGRAFLAGAQGRQEFKDEVVRLSKLTVIAIALYIASLGTFSLLILSLGYANGQGANAVDDSHKAIKEKYELTAENALKRNEIAEKIAAKKLEELRTAQARGPKLANSLISTGMLWDSKVKTTADLAELQYAESGNEYATNLGTTFKMSDMTSFQFGGYLAGIKSLVTSTKYIQGVKIFDKSEYKFFISDVLDMKTSNFEISLKNDVVNYNEDYNSNDDNSTERRNIIVAGMKGDTVSAITILNGLQTKINASLLSGDGSYLTDTYLTERKALMDNFVKNFKSVESDVKSIQSVSGRVDVTSSFLALIAAKQMGLNNTGDNDPEFIKIYNDWLEPSMVDWLSVNCTVPPKEYELNIKEVDKLNRNTDLVAGKVYGSIDVSCLKATEKGYESLFMDSQNHVTQIKNKYANAKSHTKALQIYYNIVSLAAIDAFYEVSSDISISSNECRQNLKSGMVGLPLQLRCLAEATHTQALAAARLSQPIQVIYTNSPSVSKTFINELVLFGRPGSKNYVDPTKQTSILNAFPVLPFDVLWDNEAGATGNYTEIWSQEDNAEIKPEQEFMEKIIDEVASPVLDVLKYRAAYPQDMTIFEAVRKCGLFGCNDTYKPTFFESTIIGGQKITNSAMTCIAVIHTTQAVNSVLDVGDGLNAASGVAAKEAAATVKTGARVVKAASAAANAAAEGAKIPCYTMLGQGLTESTILPVTYMISLIGPIIVLVATLYGLSIFIFPALCVDVIAKNARATLKLGRYLLAVIISPIVLLAGLLISFSLMTLSFSFLTRIIIIFGFSSGSSIMVQAMTVLATFIINLFVWKWIAGISIDLVTSIMNFLELRIDLSSATQFNNTLGQVASGQVAAHQMNRTISTFTHMSTAQLNDARKSLDNEFQKRSNKEFDMNAKKQGPIEQAEKTDAAKDNHKTQLPSDFEDLSKDLKPSDKKDDKKDD